MKTLYRKYRIMRILFWTLLVVLLLIVFVTLFIRIYPSFGGRPSKADREDYQKRAAGYFDGVRFRYPAEWEISGVAEDVRASSKGTSPKEELPVEKPDFTTAKPDDVTVTWFGHSSVLIQMHGEIILIDPVFSKRSSPVQWVGPSRFTEPSVALEDLPRIDAVLISHDHYDHLDMDTDRKSVV